MSLTQYREQCRLDAVALVALLASLLAGCAAVHTDYLLLDPQTCHKAGIPIDLYYEQPDIPYTAVAKIEAIRNRLRGASWEDVKLALCHEAQDMDMGIDALYGIQDASVSTSAALGPIGTGGETEKLTGIAIRYDKKEGD